MTKILFRADGNNDTGLGHIYRLIALVEIYKNYFEFIFITKEGSTPQIFPKDYSVVFIPNSVTIDEEPAWLQNQFNPQDHLIIADGYQFTSNYQKQLKERAFKLIYIDDLIEGMMHADVVINHAPNITESQYQTSGQTTFALGSDYAILRPSFIKAAQTHKKIDAIQNAFVCFGGADALDLSLKATQALLAIKSIKVINIVLGAAYRHCQIENLAKAHQHIKIHKNLDEVALCNLMQSCQIAIAPSSTIVYELCCVKMPIVSGYFVSNQKNIYNALLEKGAIKGAGDFSSYSTQDFKEKIEELVSQNNILQYIEAQQQLFDGKSTNRFMHLLNTLLITFRKASMSDMRMVYDWSNEPLIRQNSYDSEPIQLESHKNWFSEKIKDKQSLFLIAFYDGQPAGVVRYDIGIENSIVGVLITENFRGRKLAASFLSESSKLYFKQNNLPIFAYIKEANKASTKAFKSAGYSFFKNEIIKGIPSLVYKLELNDYRR